jgi:H(+)-transporting ATP synthase subunit D
MRRARHVAATRHELLRLSRRLARVRTAAELLTRKRRALVNELFLAARPALHAREAIAWQSGLAFAALLHARGDRGLRLLRALGLPTREIGVELRLTEAWGLPAAEIVAHDPVRRKPAERGVAVGAAGPAATSTAEAFEQLTALLLDAASREILIRRLAAALADTSRRVNRLERRVEPELRGEAARVRATLEEREREEQHRYRRLARERAGRPARR